MEEAKEVMQFDSLLGGQEDLPHDVHVLKFAAARSKEISAMTECIMNPCSSKLIFQTLPVHMRRRIMSHNSKRLPRKLRQAHEAQLQKSGLPTKQKTPSRKYRRRPQNLLQEYNRRQKEYVWLETHIWHAKRFHMTRKWGYKLPEAPCDKAFRACYRAGSKHCLLQDKSYYCSVQLYGNVEELMAGFKRISSPKCRLGLTSKAYLSGKKEGNAFVFDIDQYPFNCVGQISFIWKSISESVKCIWMFIHPSFYKDIVNILVKCFNLAKFEKSSSVLQNTIVTETGAKSRRSKKLDTKITDIKFENRQTIDKINNTYKNESSIRLLELKDNINRFSLTGPLSHAVLSKALSPADIRISDKIQNSLKSGQVSWLNESCIDSTNFKDIHKTQAHFWQKFSNLNSPAELPCNLIVGLNVKDPRINFPVKRTKAVPLKDDDLRSIDYIMMPDNINYSPLWDTEVRNSVSNNIISNLEMNKLREKSAFVPGSNSTLLENISDVPVLLVQKPGSQNSQFKRIGYNSGWDVIIPVGYGMAFWMAFILRGARAGGLRETVKLAFESGHADQQPDTPACQDDQLKYSEALRNKYFRLPPNKRVNFLKLSINSPFLCRWQTLVNDWIVNANEHNSDKFFVLREKLMLEKLQDMLKSKKVIPSFDWSLNCIVPVRLFTSGKGKLSTFAVICLPNKHDSVQKNNSKLVEPLRIDKNQKIRHALHIEHKKELVKLRRRRVRSKRKELENSQKHTIVKQLQNGHNSKTTKGSYEHYTSEMKELWLPTKVDNVRSQCSREVIGYVTHGDFSFTEAQSCGIGYIALQSFLHLVQDYTLKDCLILTRNTTSRQYRLAKIEVICDLF